MMPTADDERSRGYDRVARDYVEAREARRIGADTIRAWARELPPRAHVLDLGCGAGDPVSTILEDLGHDLWAIDASPRLLDLYRARFPQARTACEPVETSAYFARDFDGVVAIGLLFLLDENEQRALLHRLGSVLRPGGRLLFSAPREHATWNDTLTGRPSVSLGAETYRATLGKAGLHLEGERDDEGQNHYYSARRRRG